jgi:hypothetical protein
VRRLLLSIPLLVVCGVLLAGCGGGGGGSKKSADEWATGYCSAATTWVTTLEEARKSARTGSTSPSNAAQTVTNQTNTFTQAIGDLGEPDTPDGSTSAATAKDLTTTLQGRVGRISAAASTNNPDATVASRQKIVQDQIAASLSDVAATTGQLETNDAALGTAIKASPDCTALDKALASAS